MVNNLNKKVLTIKMKQKRAMITSEMGKIILLLVFLLIILIIIITKFKPNILGGLNFLDLW